MEWLLIDRDFDLSICIRIVHLLRCSNTNTKSTMSFEYSITPLPIIFFSMEFAEEYAFGKTSC